MNKNKFAKVCERMICSCCGNEMTKGVVQSARMFFFTEKESKNRITPYVGGGEKVVLSSNNWTGPVCVAYHCSECKKVVLCYSEETE